MIFNIDFNSSEFIYFICYIDHVIFIVFFRKNCFNILLDDSSNFGILILFIFSLIVANKSPALVITPTGKPTPAIAEGIGAIIKRLAAISNPDNTSFVGSIVLSIRILFFFIPVMFSTNIFLVFINFINDDFEGQKDLKLTSCLLI